MTVYLSAENVQKSYGQTVAVKDASLELYQGEILAPLGPNGAGKTTFIKILATLLRKDGGRVEILGYDLDQHEGEVRHLFGYVGQHYGGRSMPSPTICTTARLNTCTAIHVHVTPITSAPSSPR